MSEADSRHGEDFGADASSRRGLTARIVKAFTISKRSLLFLIASLLAGVAALILTPQQIEGVE